ncbi:MAG TPA: hypothetical protein PK453_08480 [Leptospiraceae bacterium]|nr:hypothetical protein [Leptospiraceae bacterium]HMY65240.1 hypothetical protein [Leptospiraceae bacterium]HNF13690.1 hypothetical protein [Leptospiraceae bacterium]HNF24426.1 hypothetical protein [Leptospiraceae bacterium]HNI98302.1 hypothetical protein [Leptospiraceae bacterium]
MHSLKLKILAVVVLFLAAVRLLDYVLFEKLYFLFPNEMEWDTSPWYNFEHSRKNLKTFSADENGILISGSSVALYSAFPGEIEKKLKSSGMKNPSLHFYSHVAMNPSDFYYYAEDIISKKPKTVIYLLNTGDFQLDYFHFNLKGLQSFLKDPHRPAGEGDEDRIDYDEKRKIAYKKDTYPVKIFYPFEFLKDHLNDLGRQEIFSLLTKTILSVNRVRIYFLDPLTAYYDRHFRKARSYHNYTGAVLKEGIWRKGWTPKEFHIECEADTGILDDSIFIPVPETVLTVKDSDGRELFSRKYEKSGWTDLNIQLKNGKETLHFISGKTVSSRVIDPKSYAREEFYGIRLSQNFCKSKLEENIAYRRTESLEDTVIRDMTVQEYEADYSSRLFKDEKTRFELGRHLHVHTVKTHLADDRFVPHSEWKYMEKSAEALSRAGIKFIIVNNPESPDELKIYKDGKWYKGYLDYMNSLTKIKGVYFFDRKDFIKDLRRFWDTHHLTTVGADEMTEEYAKIITDVYNEK